MILVDQLKIDNPGTSYVPDIPVRGKPYYVTHSII